MTAHPLILTARMDEAAYEHFNRLRTTHFPPARNQLDAHLTLFHKLPGEDTQEVGLQLRHICQNQVRMEAEASSVRFLGQGVAIDVVSKALCELRSAVAGSFFETLGPQDRQPFRPHVTIQNKASADAARSLHAQMAATFTPFPFHITGLTLWRYMDGPWDLQAHIDFKGMK